jgi:hypothetical protein
MTLLSLWSWLTLLLRAAVCRRPRPQLCSLRARLVPRLEALEGRAVPSTLTVTSGADSGTGSLRAAIAAARGGDQIVFAPTVHAITLSSALTINKGLDIEGPGANLLAVSGNDSTRVFDISSRPTVTIAGLTIRHGRADSGGGILNEANANLTLSHVNLSDNQAAGGLGGGAIFNDAGASLSIIDSSLAQNQAATAVSFTNATGGAGGGAIFNNFGATLRITGSDLSGNQALTTFGFDNFGGGIYNLGGTATITACTLANNQVSGGGSSTIFGGSSGGAVANDIGARLTVTGSSFTNNKAVCASGGFFTFGGALDNELASTATISLSRFTDNQSRGGAGGSFSGGYGGAIGNSEVVLGGDLNVTSSTFTGNQAIGADAGGIASGGGIDTEGGGNVSASHCTFTANRARGGDGGVATDINPDIGNALGGGITFFGAGTYTVDQCTFTGNQAIGGSGASGGSTPLRVPRSFCDLPIHRQRRRRWGMASIGDRFREREHVHGQSGRGWFQRHRWSRRRRPGQRRGRRPGK